MKCFILDHNKCQFSLFKTEGKPKCGISECEKNKMK